MALYTGFIVCNVHVCLTVSRNNQVISKRLSFQTCSQLIFEKKNGKRLEI